MAQWSSRKFLGLTWSGVVAASLLVGCGGDVATEPTDLMQDQQQQAAAEPEPEPSGKPSIHLASLEAIPLDSTLSAKTRSLIRARLVQGQEQIHREVPVTDDTGAQLVLRDTGTDGDEKAGDLVFSAIGNVDFDSHLKTQDRITQFQAENPQERLTFATFDNRELVAERAVTALSRDVFRPGIPIPLFPVFITTAVKPQQSLIITHTNVVNDPTRTYNPCTNTGNPNGVWTFNHLMTQMANTPATGITPANFTEQWLSQWNFNQVINSWTVPARTNMNTRILNPWPRIGGQLDMTQSAFKLLAIVNRLDLGKAGGPVGYGGSSGAGELRFVFAAVDKSAGCAIRPFLVIFEYGVPKTGCSNVKTWAQQWLALSNTGVVLGSAAYNASLQALTQQVVMANAAPTKPNGSAINQIRTNENMLANPWQLREFRLSATGPTPNFLAGNTVVLTPGDARNNTAILANFINANSAAIINNSYTVPLTYPTIGTPFLGAFSSIPVPATTFWNAPGIGVPLARHKFSLNTCNSCHGRETNTSFTHINQFGGLSGFLSAGMPPNSINTAFNVADPVNGVVRPFFEIRDRAQHLDSVANQSCLIRAFDLSILAVH